MTLQQALVSIIMGLAVWALIVATIMIVGATDGI